MALDWVERVKLKLEAWKELRLAKRESDSGDYDSAKNIAEEVVKKLKRAQINKGYFYDEANNQLKKYSSRIGEERVAA